VAEKAPLSLEKLLIFKSLPAITNLLSPHKRAISEDENAHTSSMAVAVMLAHPSMFKLCFSFFPPCFGVGTPCKEAFPVPPCAVDGELFIKDPPALGEQKNLESKMTKPPA
jgi:hypothetical protein